MRAIVKRELKAYFISPIGYACIAILLALYGYYFYQVMMLRSSYYIQSVYSTMFIWSMMVIPIITMRSFSEEIRNRTDQALLTAPVGVTSIVVGKFLAAVAVFAIALLGSLIPAVVIGLHSSLSWAHIFGNILGTLLYGAGMIAVGIYISSLTQSQIVAAISTFGVSIILMVVNQLNGLVTDENVTKVINWISFDTRFQPFTKGILNIPSIVFFLSVAAVFIFLTARKLESKRWS
ncbi:ABC transporter permease subunit [Caproiciproducens galactitolivorans]|uniref:ABC-2 family transporter protein n=1 Tax=Caproiciproducens galactitolivorans TaxID=642589 RepID=A0A4Z0YDM2_9FIRM|nr:ABC transporter permease subunit [Caproiciproducens galactitolivorans]QEY35213.1 ABC transporter permease subunit [Caproiciproducens galactitolivorans]TGJ76903.1 ABC-2 family transporter protein [Caproiciproducens galactitolivorans]